MDRREFLVNSSALLGTGLSASLFAGGSSPEQKKTLRLAVMGLNGRGKGLLNGFTRIPNIEIAYLCDPDENTIPGALAVVKEKQEKSPEVIADFRRALDDPKVDVLVCAAPDHWHAIATVWACQAGKDVYVEKPVSHNVREGEKAIAAARKHNRIVQAGTQRRSDPGIKAAVEALHSGKIGKVYFARTWITSQRPNIGHVDPSPPPQGLDFDLWCGPGPNRGYKSNLVHYHWHWRWDYGTGECGNNGIHGLDVARWGMGVEEPRFISCGGDKFSFDDDQETPDTQLATFDFSNGSIQWEHRTWSKRGIDGLSFGIVFYGTEGTILVADRYWKVFDGEKEVEHHENGEREMAHLQNFVDCVESRSMPNADIEIAHRSTQLCHFANIAWRTRSTLNWEAEQKTVASNPAAEKLLSREYRKGFEI